MPQAAPYRALSGSPIEPSQDARSNEGVRYVVLGADPDKGRVGRSAGRRCQRSRVFCFDPDHLPVDGTPRQKINFICIGPERARGGVYRLVEAELIDEVLILRRSTWGPKYVGIGLGNEGPITGDG